MPYAADTKVPIERTRAEIERLLTVHGATGYQSGWIKKNGIELAAIGVEMRDRKIRFELPMPDPKSKEFTEIPGRSEWSAPRQRPAGAARQMWEQACRARWRALLLTIKAKLESVEAKIETFEEAFLANVVLPDGTTVSHWLRPQLDMAYRTSRMPTNLLTGDVVDGVVEG